MEEIRTHSILQPDAVASFENPAGALTLAVASYKLVSSGETSSEPSLRTGALSLFQASGDELELIHQEITTGFGVFDVRHSRLQRRLLCAFSNGVCAVVSEAGKWNLNSEYGTSETTQENLHALSVCWNHASQDVEYLCSYSDGRIEVSSVENPDEPLHSWRAHMYPGNQMGAEVWTAEFDPRSRDILASGADEGCLKLWDLRSGLSRPTSSSKTAHGGAGVCSLQFDAEHRLYSGGYDETIREWDVRNLSKGPILVSSELGGGVWRMRLHGSRIVAACMRGGFHLLNATALTPVANFRPEASWEALAYGLDWPESRRDLVVGGSFYDGTLRAFRVASDGS